ncbi:MAG: DUF3540 domain-containing protein [Myxococcota bacterium]
MSAADNGPDDGRVVAPDGGSARLVDDTIEVLDPEGRLLVRYTDGVAEVAPTAARLRLRSTDGDIELEAARDVVIRTGRDVVLDGKREVKLEAGRSCLVVDRESASVTARRLEAAGKLALATLGRGRVIAESLHTEATTLSQKVEELTSTAGRVVEVSTERLIDVAERFETRAERWRCRVSDLFDLETEQTRMRSRGDTAIDGDQIYLG